MARREPSSMHPSRSSIHASPCTIRQVRSSLPSIECHGCRKQAPRVWDVTRVAIDIDLDQPVVLAVEVSVHRCQACHRLFRAQPPFLRPGAIYTRRVVQKAIEAVYCDGMAARDVPDRLARDFWVHPTEKMVRLWCRAFADHLEFETDYQPWVIASFSGVLCVDELYQGEVALLLAVDPAAPEGDRLVGYMLVSKGVDATAVKTFLGRLKSLGIEPAEVITDDSALYPAVLAQIWPAAAHQLCLFHATRHVVEAVNAVIKRVRKSLPVPPPTTAPSLHGRLRQIPLDPDQHDLAAERYRWRRHGERRASPRSTLYVGKVSQSEPWLGSSGSIGGPFTAGSSCRHLIKPASRVSPTPPSVSSSLRMSHRRHPGATGTRSGRYGRNYVSTARSCCVAQTT